MSTRIILDHLAEANPVPERGLGIDDSKLLLAIRERSVDMSTSTENKATKGIPPSANLEDPKRPLGWFAALAAFAIVVVVGAVVLLATSNTDTPPASSPTTQALPAEGPAAPVSVVVPSTEQWTDTGIDLSIGDTVLIEADGAVTPTRNPVIPLHDPNGHPDPTARQYNVEGLEEANHNSLIGRIGEAGAPFLVGSQLLTKADTEGRLFLGINDINVLNNSGEFTATITVNP